MIRAASRQGALAVTPHHHATDAALAVMEAGGSAIDGAVAANAVLGVVAPETCGPGGDLFALIHEPGRVAPACLNASGRAGSSVDTSALRAEGHLIAPGDGPHALTIPGCVDGWELLLERFGRLELQQTLVPALEHAHGFEASPELAQALRVAGKRIFETPAAKSFFTDGVAAKAGDKISRPDLIETLEAIATGGRTAFFDRIGPGLVEASEGAISVGDFRTHQAEWVEPLGARVAGHIAWTTPPNSQGYLVLAAGWIADRLALGADPTDPAFHHALIEAYRSVAWERDELVSEPDSAPVPPEALVDEGYLSERLSGITPERAGVWGAPPPAVDGTAYLCVADSDGVGVSLIQSNWTGFGSGRSAGDTGIFLHNRGQGFTLEPGHPNELRPGARPLHTLSPTLWTTERGELRQLVGTRGGHHQPQIVLQMAAHILTAGLGAAEAQDQARWVIDEFGPGAESAVKVERRMPETVINGLRSRGHDVDVTSEEWQTGWGPVSAIVVDGDGLEGAADPRVSTASAAAL